MYDKDMIRYEQQLLEKIGHERFSLKKMLHLMQYCSLCSMTHE